MNKYHTLFARYRALYPRLNVVKKDESRLMQTIFWPLKKLTGNNYNNYTTTIGSTIYVPPDFGAWPDDERYILLRHEAQHVKQFHRWPFGIWAWPLNHLLMGLAYLFLLPVFLTMRAYFERAGYTQTILATYECYGIGDSQAQEAYAEWIADVFSGSSYLWMWRRGPAKKWALKTIKNVCNGELKALPEDVVDTDSKV